MAKEIIISKTYELVKFSIPVINKLPRDYKFTYGDRVISLLSDLLEQIIEVYYAPRHQKRPMLHQINIKLEKLRYYFRLAFDLGLFTSTQLKPFAEKIDEIGRLIGGWIKAIS